MAMFDNAYQGTPTWDIGRPQGAVIRLASAGLIEGCVLDVGCGTGENALYLASLGHAVLGLDLAATAIEKARSKAAARAAAAGGPPGDGHGDGPAGHSPGGSAAAEFRVWDCLRLVDLDRTFDTVIDVGLFHTLQPAERSRYARGLRAVTRPSGRLLLLCWSNRNPFGFGPERIRPSDIRAAFRSGWLVEEIEAEVLDTLLPVGQVHAWLARLSRR
jgi:SAM-dependent methyltransferase